MPPALAAGLRVRAYVSTVYGCPYEGAVDPGKAVELCRALRALGCYQVSLGDTIGVATPRQVRDVLSRVLADTAIPPADVAVHFHDTRGTALANILVAVELGITTIDSALGGLGGCPYAPGASGNVATEDVVYMLEGMGDPHRRRRRQAGASARAWPRRWSATRCRRSSTAPTSARTPASAAARAAKANKSHAGRLNAETPGRHLPNF